MSLSNQSDNLQNPATRFMEWSGSDGSVSYFDKTLGEKGAKVNVPLPFTFIPLDMLATVSGFNDASGSGIWSNEIKMDTFKTAILNVKDKNGTIAKGLYADIKDSVAAKGGKFTQSVYVAYKDENGALKIGNIKFKGASLTGGKRKEGSKEVEVGAWMEFTKGNKVLGKAISISKDETPCRKGSNAYYIPKFSLNTISEATMQTAIELDKELQVYLGQYFQQQALPEQSKQEPTMSVEDAVRTFNNKGVPLEVLGNQPATEAWNKFEESTEEQLPF